MVRRAFEVLTEGKIKTRLLAFSDDMDGLRKVPDNVPNKDMLAEDLHKPLTQVRDPFGTHDSFGAHNNARLRAFLDAFGFEYEFASSTEYYKSGRFDAALLHMLARYDAVMKIMLPTFREERAGTYSPFLPIHPVTGHVMQVSLVSHDAAKGTISWKDPKTGDLYETPVTGGHCKLQWKPDWAMRWVCAEGRLRNGRQGPDRFGQAVRRHRARARRNAAGRLQLRTLPGREGPEDFQVQGQRPHHRGMADLRRARKASRSSCSRSRLRPSGSTSTSSRARSTNISAFSIAIRSRRGRSGSAIPSGTSTTASRRRPKCCITPAKAMRMERACPSACCSISRRSQTARTRAFCGDFSGAMRPAPRRKTIRASTGWSATPSPISATSCG